MTASRAFTIIELLVVVTVIVVLLALLAPALDRAVYEAELATCGTRQHGLGTGVLAYALAHRRAFPDRRNHAQSNLVAAVPVYDDRAILRSYININGHLLCPLAGEIDIEGSLDGTEVQSTYNMWFGYGFPNHKWMGRLGGVFEWTELDGQVQAYDLLAMDLNELVINDAAFGNGALAAHPDLDPPTMSLLKVQDGLDFGVSATYTRWQSPNVTGSYKRGPLDLNVLRQDGSVELYRNVAWNQERWRPIPVFVNASQYASTALWLPPPPTR